MADEKPKGILSTIAPQSASSGTEDPLERAMRLVAEAIAKMPAPIVGRWYHQQRIAVDGYRFEHCRFDSCEIHTAVGTFNFVNCYFANCTFFFTGSADKVIRLYNVNATEAWTRWPHLAPKVNPDGTVTIQG